MALFLIRSVAVPTFRVLGQFHPAEDETLSFVELDEQERQTLEQVLGRLRSRLGMEPLAIYEVRCAVLLQSSAASSATEPVYMQMTAVTDEGRFLLNAAEQQALVAMFQGISRRVAAEGG